MFTIHFDANTGIPLYEQIYQYIKNEIRTGALLPGEKLPSSRSLAAHLQVSRNTIDMAYGQLVSEGYLESKEKKGYYACEIAPLHTYSGQPALTLQPNEIPVIKQGYQYDFSPFAIDISNFPYNTWRKLSKDVLSDNPEIFLQGPGQGDESLRNAIGRYLHESRSVSCTPDQIVVGAGTDYLLQLLIQLLPSKSVLAMENPTYTQAYRIFHGLGVTVAPISLDSSGIRVKELESSHANVAYVTPSHQYPLGVVMPVKRRSELLNWANQQTDRYIIEDDHDSEFRYKGKPIPALQGLDSGGKVIYLGTFSRAIAPAIRVAYMVLPKSLLRIYKETFPYYSSTVSRVDQNVITTFIEHGYFERHLNKMRKLYKLKHDSLLGALKCFGNKIEILGENAGLYLVIRMHFSLTEEEIIKRAASSHIRVYGMKEYYLTPQSDYIPTLLLGYANLTPDEIRAGIHILYEALLSLISDT